jgi:ATP-dependent protease Clp ATPase subunit
MMSAADNCSFCFKTPKEVKQLVVSNEVSICNECIELARDIIGAARIESGVPKTMEPPKEQDNDR